MKTNNTCPKCSGKKILRIPGTAGAYGSGNNISVGISIFNSVKVARYLCCHCGYSEEWIDQKEDIEKLTKKYKAK